MMIIDCHGHYTSEPPAFIEFRKRQIVAFQESSNVPEPPQISDDQIREKLEPAQLKFQRERGTEVTIFSPRASAMGHQFGVANVMAHGGSARRKDGDFGAALPPWAITLATPN